MALVVVLIFACKNVWIVCEDSDDVHCVPSRQPLFMYRRCDGFGEHNVYVPLDYNTIELFENLIDTMQVWWICWMLGFRYHKERIKLLLFWFCQFNNASFVLELQSPLVRCEIVCLQDSIRRQQRKREERLVRWQCEWKRCFWNSVRKCYESIWIEICANIGSMCDWHSAVQIWYRSSDESVVWGS